MCEISKQRPLLDLIRNKRNISTKRFFKGFREQSLLIRRKKFIVSDKINQQI